MSESDEFLGVFGACPFGAGFLGEEDLNDSPFLFFGDVVAAQDLDQDWVF